MNDSVDIQKLGRMVITAIGLIFAAWIGRTVGTGNYLFALLVVGAIGGIVAAAVLRTSVWYLILIAFGIGGSIPSIPGGLSLLEVACVFTFFSFVVLRAVKSVPNTPTYGLTDVVLFVIMFHLVITFIRHPVGTLFFDSDRVGGRPYAAIAIAWMGYWVLSHVRVTPKLAFRLPLFLTGLSVVGAVNGFIAFLFPATSALAPIHSSFAGPDAESAEMGETRLNFALRLGNNIIRSLCSYFPPLSNLNPTKVIRLSLFVFGFLAIGISGFRSEIVSVGVFFMVSQFYWRRYRHVVASVILVFVAIAGLLVVQAQVGLPYTIQRALSFLPGDWDPQAVMDAEASVMWRVEMWERMFEDSRYLKNRWLGDGFGFSKSLMTSSTTRIDTAKELQEYYLEVGEVHSGPVSTIRYVGYVGLALYLLFMCLIARKAHRILRRSFGTPFFPLAIFAGVGTVFYPFHFIFVYGFYHNALAHSILSLGILKMLEGSFHRYREEQKASEAEVALRQNEGGQLQTAASSRP